MGFKTTLQKVGVDKLIEYAYKDPETSLPKIMDWADKFSGGEFPSQRKAIREAIENKDHPYMPILMKPVRDGSGGKPSILMQKPKSVKPRLNTSRNPAPSSFPMPRL